MSFGTDGEDDELNLNDAGGAEEEEDDVVAEAEDRGDELDDAAALKALAEEGEDEGGPRGKGKGPVPYGRFTEVIDRAKNAEGELARERETRIRLEERLSAAEGKAAPKKEVAPTVDIDALEEQYASAVLEGDSVAAREIRKQIRAADSAEAEERAVKRVRAELAQDAEKAEFASFQREAASITTKHPELDPNSPKVNKEAIADVVLFRDSFIAKGNSITEALRLATARVVKLHGLGEKPKPKDEPKDEPLDPVAKRNAAIKARNADLEKKLVPRQKGSAGNDLDLDPETMSDAEWDKLPAAEKKRLRGDAA